LKIHVRGQSCILHRAGFQQTPQWTQAPVFAYRRNPWIVTWNGRELPANPGWLKVRQTLDVYNRWARTSVRLDRVGRVVELCVVSFECGDLRSAHKREGETSERESYVVRRETGKE
jgi:hypothetical protein